MCPHCATSFPRNLQTLDSLNDGQQHTLRLAGLVVMWAWMMVSVTAAIAATSIFILRLG